MMTLEIPFYMLLICIIITAAAAIGTRGHITSIIILSVMGVLSTVYFAILQAVDVAMAEAVIGAGLMTALFVTAISKTRRNS